VEASVEGESQAAEYLDEMRRSISDHGWRYAFGDRQKIKEIDL
jgi:hypothetical protein